MSGDLEKMTGTLGKQQADQLSICNIREVLLCGECSEQEYWEFCWELPEE